MLIRFKAAVVSKASALSKPLGAITLGFLCTLGQTSQADHVEAEIEAMTSDGRLVILLEDHSWDFVHTQSRAAENSAVITITEVKEMQDACGFQVRMKNNLGFKVRSITPRFSVYNDKNIVFDHKSLSFTSIKPGRDQYKRFQFNGIGCHEIVWMRVHDAEHCTMGGHLDKFNAEDGQCLEYITIEPSTLINVSKQPQL